LFRRIKSVFFKQKKKKKKKKKEKGGKGKGGGEAEEGGEEDRHVLFLRQFILIPSRINKFMDLTANCPTCALICSTGV
jgi:hypothetical protein